MASIVAEVLLQPTIGSKSSQGIDLQGHQNHMSPFVHIFGL